MTLESMDWSETPNVYLFKYASICHAFNALQPTGAGKAKRGKVPKTRLGFFTLADCLCFENDF